MRPAKMTRITPPLKWHGGKHYLAAKIVGLMPPRCKTPNAPRDDDAGWLHYVEPFAGGLSVLLANDPEGISEVVNDLDGDLMNFWQVLRSAEMFPRLHLACKMTAFSEAEFNYATSIRYDDLPVVRAWAFFVTCRQSLAGRRTSFVPLSRNRTRRGMHEQASAWLATIEGLPAIHQRLRRVVSFIRPALDVIRQQDGPRTLFYCDPPYLHSTRATTGEYAHEMTEEQHLELLLALNECKGNVMISGYRSPLYDQELANWNRHDFNLPNNAASGEKKRRMTECVWCNF